MVAPQLTAADVLSICTVLATVESIVLYCLFWRRELYHFWEIKGARAGLSYFRYSSRLFDYVFLIAFALFGGAVAVVVAWLVWHYGQERTLMGPPFIALNVLNIFVPLLLLRRYVWSRSHHGSEWH